jgi:predicted SnoaL-like aldol condensation-catalyzing enzyme
MNDSMDPKASAIEFLRLVTSNRIDEAYERFVAEGFRHHNPWFRGDAAALKAGMADNAAKNPDKVFEVKNAIAEGERVAVHSHLRMKPGDRGMAVVHIFRFEHGRIAELWDLGQPIPDENLNANGMF